MVQSGEEYSLEKFLEYDEVNRQYYDSKSRSYSPQWDKDDAINRTVSPQIYKTYNEILKN